jgi:hypothetical protein
MYKYRRKEFLLFQKYKIQYEKKTTILSPLIKKNLKDFNLLKHIKKLILELLKVSNNESKIEYSQYHSLKRQINQSINKFRLM